MLHTRFVLVPIKPHVVSFDNALNADVNAPGSLLALLVDDDLVTCGNVVAVQLLVRILHLFGALVVAQILIHIVQAHLGGRNVHKTLQARLQIDDRSARKLFVGLCVSGSYSNMHIRIIVRIHLPPCSDLLNHAFASEFLIAIQKHGRTPRRVYV